MTVDRATVRPITLARLVELTHACESAPLTTEDVEDALEVSHRRARAVLLEALRIDLVRIVDQDAEEESYDLTPVGRRFLDAILDEDWSTVSEILQTRSPHYGAFIDVLEDVQPISLDDLLEELQEASSFEAYTFNQTVIEVVGDWAERLGRVNRNAFTGTYYSVIRDTVPSNFPYVVLSVFDDLESSAGVNLQQRYLSIPELREHVCERLGCTRGAFDEALIELVGQNVGKLELSGAPIDTGAKEARFGIKEIRRSTADGLVSTAQSTDQVMSGVEQFDKQYYYLAVHDRDITFDSETTP
jgi:hypothetical protein